MPASSPGRSPSMKLNEPRDRRTRHQRNFKGSVQNLDTWINGFHTLKYGASILHIRSVASKLYLRLRIPLISNFGTHVCQAAAFRVNTEPRTRNRKSTTTFKAPLEWFAISRWEHHQHGWVSKAWPSISEANTGRSTRGALPRTRERVGP